MIEIDGVKAYTVKETGDILHLTIGTVRKYIHEKKLNGRKIGTRYHVTAESIKNFVEGKNA